MPKKQSRTFSEVGVYHKQYNPRRQPIPTSRTAQKQKLARLAKAKMKAQK